VGEQRTSVSEVTSSEEYQNLSMREWAKKRGRQMQTAQAQRKTCVGKRGREDRQGLL